MINDRMVQQPRGTQLGYEVHTSLFYRQRWSVRNTDLTVGGDSCGDMCLWIEIDLKSTIGTEAADHTLTAYLHGEMGLR